MKAITLNHDRIQTGKQSDGEKSRKTYCNPICHVSSSGAASVMQRQLSLWWPELDRTTTRQKSPSASVARLIIIYLSDVNKHRSCVKVNYRRWWFTTRKTRLIELTRRRWSFLSLKRYAANYRKFHFCLCGSRRMCTRDVLCVSLAVWRARLESFAIRQHTTSSPSSSPLAQEGIERETKGIELWEIVQRSPKWSSFT